MKMSNDAVKCGVAALGVGAAAAMVAGISKMNSPQKKMKKLAKKSAKAVEGIMDNVRYMFK